MCQLCQQDRISNCYRLTLTKKQSPQTGTHIAMHQYRTQFLRVCKSHVGVYSWKMLIMADIKGLFVLIHHLQYPVKVGSHTQTPENNVETSTGDCQRSCTGYRIAHLLSIMSVNASMIVIMLTHGRESCFPL